MQWFVDHFLSHFYSGTCVSLIRYRYRDSENRRVFSCPGVAYSLIKDGQESRKNKNLEISLPWPYIGASGKLSYQRTFIAEYLKGLNCGWL